MLEQVERIVNKGNFGSLCLSQEQLKELVDSCFVAEELAKTWTRREVAILLIYYNTDELFEGELGQNQRQAVLTLLAKLIADTDQHPLLRIQALRTLTRCSAAV